MGEMGPIMSRWISSKGFDAVEALCLNEALVIFTTAQLLHASGALIGIPILFLILL
jgi:hypothetical protein